MTKQITRLSPHQSGKVFAVLMTVGACLMLPPMAIILYAIQPPLDPQGNPVRLPLMMFAVLPVFYLVFGYLVAATGCVIYNLLYPPIGGFEFDMD